MFGLIPWTRRTALLPRAETPFGWIPEVFTRFFTPEPVTEMAEWPHWWGMTTETGEKEVVMKVEMPGFEPAEVKVELVGGELVVEAEHREPAEKPEERAERMYAHVKRVMTLPPGVEPEKAEATYRHGILEVHVPRTPEAVGRRIEVKT